MNRLPTPLAGVALAATLVAAGCTQALELSPDDSRVVLAHQLGIRPTAVYRQ